jgi:hypothetical protein
MLLFDFVGDGSAIGPSADFEVDVGIEVMMGTALDVDVLC